MLTFGLGIAREDLENAIPEPLLQQTPPPRERHERRAINSTTCEVQYTIRGPDRHDRRTGFQPTNRTSMPTRYDRTHLGPGHTCDRQSIVNVFAELYEISCNGKRKGRNPDAAGPVHAIPASTRTGVQTTMRKLIANRAT
eukprot:1787736-Pyramimonas_sp.AAC.1